MGTYNPVIRATENLARTLGQGISNMGNQPLDMAKFNLLESQTLADIANRNKQNQMESAKLELAQNQDARLSTRLANDMDVSAANQKRAAAQEQRAIARAAQLDQMYKLGLPAAQLAATKAGKESQQIADWDKLQNEEIGAPGMFNLLLGDNPSRESMSDILSNDKLGEVASVMGGRIIKTQNGIRLQKKDGSLATWKDMPGILSLAKPVLRSGRDPVLFAKQKIREYEKVGTDGLPPEELQRYESLKKSVRSPEWKINAYQKLQEADVQSAEEFARRGLPTGAFERNIKRRAAKIAEQKGIISNMAKQANKIEIENIKVGKPQKGTMQKNAEFYYQTFKDSGVTKQDSAKWAEMVQSKPQRLALAKTLIDNLPIMQKKETQAEIKKILQSQGLSSVNTKNDPDGLRELLFK